MLRKLLILTTSVFLNTSCFASTAAPFEHDIFEVNRHYNIKGTAPSFKKLHLEAEKRKRNLTQLFSLIRSKGVNNPQVKELFKNEVKFFDQLRATKMWQAAQSGSISFKSATLHLPDSITLLHRLKCDHTLDYDLMDYFSICLSRFSKTPPSSEQLHMLYDQAVYVVRTSLESLWGTVFSHLMIEYPKHFIEFHGMRQVVDLDKVLNKFKTMEELSYFEFLRRFSATGIPDKDTIEITEMAFYLLNRYDIENPGVIYELNNILFYLNIERSLLAHAPDLQYDKSRYSLDGDCAALSDQFYLSRLIKSFRTGLIGTLSSTITLSEKVLSGINKKIHDYTISALDFHDTQGLALYLSRLFPIEHPSTMEEIAHEFTSPVKSITRKKTSGKKTKKAKKAKASINQKAQNNIPTPEKEPASKPQKSLQEQDHSDTLFLGSEEEIPTLAHSEEENSPSEASYLSILMKGLTLNASDEENNSHTNEAPIKIRTFSHAHYTPYTPTVSFDTFAYKRSITHRPNNLYQFDGQAYNFGVLNPFSKDLLQRIKNVCNNVEKIGKMPNLATYAVRFHVKIGNATTYSVYQFSPSSLFLSGSRYFQPKGFKLKKKAQIKNTYHDLLSEKEQEEYLKTYPEDRKTFLLQTMQQKLQKNVATGPWGSNAADSESLIVLEIQEKMPLYLRHMTENGTIPIEIGGVVLGINSYYDVCWRCRNLVQAWQWGLSDTITHWAKEMEMSELVRFSPNFGTVALTFGEVAPHRNRLNSIRKVSEDVILGNAHPRDQHQFVAIPLKQ